MASSSSLIERKQAKPYKGLGIATAKMLQMRELYGNVATSVKGKYSFREEYTKRIVSEPLIWRYRVKDTVAWALEQVDIVASSPEGEFETDLLISGDKDGSVSFHVVLDKDDQESHYGEKIIPDCAWPLDIKNKDGFAKSPGHLWTLHQRFVNTSSSIRCIKKLGSQHKYLIASSENHPPFHSHVFVMNFFVHPHSISPLRVHDLYLMSLNGKIWDADYNSDGSRALIGTNLGAALLNVEIRAQSWVCRCESDILSVQLDNSEQTALCGLRNGAIVSVDLRLRPHARITRKSIVLQSKSSSEERKRRGFEFGGSINPSGTISTASSISCLTSLELYDQYFLATSVDGSTKLYDHRMVQRGAVLSYQGNVGFQHAIQRHAVDPCENFVMSGGQDSKVRLWSVKSGELLFEEMFMGSLPLQYCWGKKDNSPRVRNIYSEHSSFGEAWIGAGDGLYLMRW